uniref:Major facilitator superfamily (MFS) profile domain-containing protein n=2 Tax=Leersia perrieri TaxID=77586 RepID=A0A0D9WV83_9ORYZ
MAPEIEEEQLIVHPYSGGRITPFVVLSCLTACTGGIIFGYDIGVSGGVSSMDAFLQQFFPDVYQRTHSAAAGDDRISNYCRFDSQLLTAFTSSLYVAGLATTFAASSVTARRGRRASIIIAGVAIVAGATVGAAAGNIATLIAGRLLVGVGVGFGNQAVPLYLSEMAPPSRRGAFSNGFQLCVSVGAFAAQAINFSTEKISGGWGWRVSLAVAAVPAAFLAVAVVFLLPETPNSLIQQGENHQNVRSLLAKLRGVSVTDTDDEFASIVAANAATSNTTARHGFTLMLTQRRYRPQLVMALAIPFFQQMTGINAIAFYAPVLLRTAGVGESAALLAVVAKQFLSIGATLVSMIAVDRFGRRTLFLAGGIQMIISQILIGAIMASQLGDDGDEQMSQSSSLLLIILVAVYVAGFAWSWGPLGWLVPSEIFPLEVRSAGQSIAVAVNFTLTTAVAQSFLAMLCHMKAGIFFFFAAWLVVMTAFVYVFLPETKGLKIEEVGKLWVDHWFWRRFVVDHISGDGEEEERDIDGDKL